MTKTYQLDDLTICGYHIVNATACVEFDIDGDPATAYVDDYEATDENGNSVFGQGQRAISDLALSEITKQLEGIAVQTAWDDDCRPSAADCREDAYEFSLDCEIV